MLPSLQEPKSCHICDFSTTHSTFYSCTNSPYCSKHFCISCIKIHFSTQSSPNQFKISSWLCYSCQSKCQCSKCTRKKSGDSMLRFSISDYDDSNKCKAEKKIGNDKKNGSKKTINQTKFQDEQNKDFEIYDLEQESQEYVTTNLLKEMEKPSHNKFSSSIEQNGYVDVFRQESMTPHDYSSEFNIGNERKSKTIIKCKKQRSFVGLKAQKVPPYLESIMKRKQLFRNFMLKHSKKSYEQLVGQEIARIQEEKKCQSQIQKAQRKDIPSPVMKTFQIHSNGIVDNLFSPFKVPETPSFLPLPQPVTPVSTTIKITQLLNEQLKQYEMEEDDLSIELL